MKRFGISIIGLVMGVMIGNSLLSQPIESEDDEPILNEEIQTQVRVETVSQQVLSRTLTFPGTVRANSEVEIIAEIGGQITEVYIQEGEVVGEDQLLISIEQDASSSSLVNQYDQYAIALSSAQTTLSNLNRLYQEDRERIQLSIEELEDALDYAETNEGLTSDNYDAQVSAYEAQVQSALTNLELAEITLENAEEQAAQTIENAEEQAESAVIGAMDSVDATLRALDEVLGIDKENFDGTYRDILDTNSHHSYLVRTDSAYREARDHHDSLAEMIESGEVEVTTLTDEMETTIELTSEALYHMEVLLNLEITINPFMDEFEALRSEYDSHQASMDSLLLSIQSYAQTLESAELSYEITVEEANANLEVAEDSYNTAVANLESIESQSTQQSTSAESSVTSLENQLESAYQSLELLEAQYADQIDQASYQVQLQSNQLEQAQIQVESGLVMSPTSGTIANMNIEVGEVINPGISLATVVDTERFEVEFFISEFDLALFDTGAALEVHLDAYPEEPLMGWVTYIAPIADPVTRTFEVKASIELNEGYRMASGMTSEVHIEIQETEEPVLAVPVESIISRNGSDYLFVVQEDEAGKSRSEKREVRLGVMTAAKVEILEGVAANEHVIVQGQNLLRGGEAIEILDNQ